MDLPTMHVDSRTLHRIGHIFWYRRGDEHLFRTGNHFGETSPPTSVQLGEHVIQNQHGLPITVRAGI